MGSDSSCMTALAFAVPATMIGGVVMVILASISLRGWGAVLDVYWSEKHVAVVATVVASILLSAVIASVIAKFCYDDSDYSFVCATGVGVTAFVVLCVIVTFLGATILGFDCYGMAKDWKSKFYPVLVKEVEVKDQFDDIYCHVQRVHACNSDSFMVAAELYGLDINIAPRNHYDILLLCRRPTAGLAELCEQCELSNELDSTFTAQDWLIGDCPGTPEVLNWCGAYLLGTNGTVHRTGEAPYSSCRGTFLSFVMRKGLLLGIGGILALAPIHIGLLLLTNGGSAGFCLD